MCSFTYVRIYICMYVCIMCIKPVTTTIHTVMAKEDKPISLDDIRSSDECKIP